MCSFVHQQWSPAREKRRAWSKNVKCDSPPASSYVYAPLGGGGVEGVAFVDVPLVVWVSVCVYESAGLFFFYGFRDWESFLAFLSRRAAVGLVRWLVC